MSERTYSVTYDLPVSIWVGAEDDIEAVEKGDAALAALWNALELFVAEESEFQLHERYDDDPVVTELED